MAALLLVPLAGCGGSATGTTVGFVETLVRLLSARFVPASVSVPRGTTRTVDLEVTCDKAGLDTVFGRLGIRARLDPQGTLPAGITATFNGLGAADSEGFTLVPCNGAHSDPNLRIAHLPVRIQATANQAATTVTLVGFIEVERVNTGDPSRDSTRADLAVSVTVGEGTGPTT